MIPVAQPNTFAEIADLCKSSRRILPVGSQSKRALTIEADSNETTIIEMRGHSGIVTYDPSEFLISARGGTTIEELSQVLAAQGQYLPFDPMLVAQGATLGGSIASGISGPCRLLYGGLRDFMLEVQLCDSAGREVRGGGKVVKNAAGFDLPKLMVGSYGRLGIITEATVKVFPKPPGNLTLCIQCPSLRSAIDRSLKLLALPLSIAALEVLPQEDGPGPSIAIRLAGPTDSLPGMAQRVQHALPPGTQTHRLEPGEDEIKMWTELANFGWTNGYDALARVAITHHQCCELQQELQAFGDAGRLTISCGASVAWVALRRPSDLDRLDGLLSKLMLAGVALRGSDSLRLLGDRRWVASTERIQAALDPANKYLMFAS